MKVPLSTRGRTAPVSWPLFRELDPVTWAQLSEAAERRSLDPGEVMVREGDEPTELFLVMRGQLSVTRGGKLVTLIDAPETIGLLALVDGGPRSATLTATTRVEAWSLSRQVFDELRESNPRLAANVLQLLVEVVRTRED